MTVSVASETVKVKKYLGFWNAGVGLVYAFTTQTNLRVHIAAALAVIGAGFYLDCNKMEWCVLLICIGMVLVAELLNTALEAVVDLVTTDFHPLARIAKDVSAGAVLVAAILAAVMGVLIFLPKIMEIQ